ncbi:UNVERIFIED_CONTAM: hypothetical protein NCL1_17154 [Trichonephila clavipes]
MEYTWSNCYYYYNFFVIWGVNRFDKRQRNKFQQVHHIFPLFSCHLPVGCNKDWIIFFRHRCLPATLFHIFMELNSMGDFSNFIQCNLSEFTGITVTDDTFLLLIEFSKIF